MDGDTYERPRYKQAILNQFVKDMLHHGLKPIHYFGRWHWHGPAVHVDNISDAMAITRVPCQHDNMGLGFIVYPIISGFMLEKKDFHLAEHGWVPPEEEVENCPDCGNPWDECNCL